MPFLRFQDDGSIGQALSQLSAGVGTMFDPRLPLQADYLRAQIANSRANAANTQLQTQQLQGQLEAQRSAQGAFGGYVDANFPRPDFEMQSPGVQGPAMPAPMIATEDARRNSTLGVMKAGFNNAILRGGNPLEALQVIPKAMAYTGIAANGMPQDEAGARQTQTLLQGALPDARTPLTEGQRVTLGAEDLRDKKELEAFKISKSPLDITGGKTFAIPQNGGPPMIFGPAQYGGQGGNFAGGLYGDTLDAQASRILERTAVLVREGRADPSAMDAYDEAWHRLYGPKTETRDVNGQTQVVQLQNPVPSNRPHPNDLRKSLGIQPGLGSGATSNAAPAPQSGGAAPAPVQPGGVVTNNAPSPAPAGGAAVSGALGYRPGLPSEQITLQGLLSQMESGDDLITKMTKAGNLPSTVTRELARPGALGDNAVGNIAQGMLVSDTGKEFQAASQAYLDGVLRKVSGAVISPSEYKQVESYTIPKPGDSPGLIEWKAMNRQLIKDAWKGGALGEQPSAIAGNVRRIIDERNPLPNSGAPAAAAPAPATGPVSAPKAQRGADPYADVDAIVGLKRR